jgi:hypothetical protein
MSFIRFLEHAEVCFIIINQSNIEHWKNSVVVEGEDGIFQIFDSEESAGQEAREYWENYITESPAEEVASILGTNTLIAWALGKYAGPGTTKVKNLNEWLDLYLTNYNEHFENEIVEIESYGENVENLIGFCPKYITRLE